MQIIETEYLKPCPFCGGKPILRAMDNNSQNGTVTTEIRCENCHSAGQTTVSFSHSVAVGDERHKGIVKKIVEAWNSRAGEPDKKQLINICDALLDLSCILERGRGMTQELITGYFGDSVKTHEENRGTWLLYYYDNARIFAGIADDYVRQALQAVGKLEASIDLGGQTAERKGGAE